MTEVDRLEPAPRDRVCPRCSATIRPSHQGYAGGGRLVAVLRCSGCGITYRGAERDASEVERRRAEELRDRRGRREERAAGRSGHPGGQTRGVRPGRRPLEAEGPDNPVLDEATAERLRDLLGG